MAEANPAQSPPPSFDVAAQQLLDETIEIIHASKALQDRLARELTPETATFETLLLPLLHDDHEASRRLCIYRLFSSVSEDVALRDASRRAEQMRAKDVAESLMRKDIADLIKAVYEKTQHGQLDHESAHMLFKTHRAYQNAGAGIQDPDVRARYLAAVDERNKLLVEAKKTLSESDDGVWFPRAALAGVPAAALDSMESSYDGQHVRVTFKKGHWIPVMKFAVSAATRKTLHLARQSRFPENVSRLERLVALRDEIARMLGFGSHAALKMEDKMADSVGDVVERLEALKTDLAGLAADEIETLRRLKLASQKQQQKDGGDYVGTDDVEDDARLNAWDWQFYARTLERERYSVDSQLVSEYFEIGHSLKGMLRIFEHLFGMRFDVVDDAPTWQRDVVVYSTWDSEENGGEFLGYLYLDLFARDGKFSGAHCSLIQPGFTKEDGTRHYPASSLICSFIKSPGKPTLLQHSELKTMFHELGHAIHKLVTRTRYHHGCARDFVEIPSILLENWIWVPSVLEGLGRHYSYASDEFREHYLRANDQGEMPPEKMPSKLAQDLARTKHVNGAHAMLHQVFLALFDLCIHNQSSPEAARAVDTTQLWNQGKADVIGLYNVDGIGQASFAHPFRGYDAAYFTYALSKVFATDIWVSAFRDDPMNREAGRKYREVILQPGGGRPEGELLRRFLGRQPDEAAYHDELATGAMTSAGL